MRWVLVSQDESRRQVFAIDNGVSFGPRLWNFFVPNWNRLRVAALRKDSIDRLRKFRREDLDFLLVVQQLEADPQGMLRIVESGLPLDPDDGAQTKGGTVQFGLTRDEIDDVYERIQQLIERVDAGEIPVF